MNVFDLFAKISLDTNGYEKGLSKASQIADKFKNGLQTAFKLGAAAIGATTTAVSGLVAASTNAYAEYEQLVGGVETLFKESADVIQEYADRAYQTAGLSANQYMETVTSFSASLLQSLGGDTQKAAEYADQAIIDMSDNANKMGTSMEAIQNAYQGFAKQNYSMLDNLKLGYGGTAEEMYRLLQDAASLDAEFAKTAKFSIDPKGHLEAGFADITQAIHIVQEEMGIAGTTSKEAADTISGSVGSIKAAWDNLVTGLARDDADIEDLINKVVVSAETAFKNILPTAERALKGVGNLVSSLAPIIAQELPMLINDIVPDIIESGVSFLTTFLTAISDNLPLLIEGALSIINTLVTGILDNLPLIVSLGLELLLGLANGIAEALPELIPTVVDVILQITETLIDNIDKIVDGAIAIILGLADGIMKAMPKLLEKAPIIIQKLINALSDNAPKLIEAATQIITMLTTFLTNDEILDMLVQGSIDITLALVDSLINDAPMLVDAAIQIMSALAGGLIMYIGKLIEKTPEIIEKFVGSFSNFKLSEKVRNVGKDIIDKVSKGIADTIIIAKDWGRDLIDNFIAGVTEKWDEVTQTFDNVGYLIKEHIGFSEPEKGPLSDFHTYAPDMMKLFAEGIEDNTDVVTDQIKKSFDFSNLMLNSASGSMGTGSNGISYEAKAPTPTIIQLVINDREIAKAILPALNDEKVRLGTSIVTV